MRWPLDLERLARKAEFDSWELKVLEYRRQGVSRPLAMSEQPDNDSRLAIQAAWKRVDRTGMQRLRECRKKNEVFVPSERPPDTRNMRDNFPLQSDPARVLQAAWKHSGGTSRMDLAKFLGKYRLKMSQMRDSQTLGI
jgi:hypothetical protein